jgi:hypothetical protein
VTRQNPFEYAIGTLSSSASIQRKNHVGQIMRETEFRAEYGLQTGIWIVHVQRQRVSAVKRNADSTAREWGFNPLRRADVGASPRSGAGESDGGGA